MKKQALKWLTLILCVLAAGICYSISRGTAKRSEHVWEYQAAAESETNPETAASFTEKSARAADTISAAKDTKEADPQGSAESFMETASESVSKAAKETTKALCYVHICGEVKKPGVYALEQGSRLFQAVELAGGFTENAAKGYLNLALTIKDGMKVVVPSEAQSALLQTSGFDAGMVPGIYQADEERKETGSDGWSDMDERADSGDQPGLSSQPAADMGKVNLNTATEEELMTLKGIGQSRAQAIIRYREEYGPFQSIEDIMKVSGIKEGAFQKIKEDITV